MIHAHPLLISTGVENRERERKHGVAHERDVLMLLSQGVAWMDANWVAGMYVCISRSFCPLLRMDGLGSSARTSFSDVSSSLSFVLSSSLCLRHNTRTDRQTCLLASLSVSGVDWQQKKKKTRKHKTYKRNAHLPTSFSLLQFPQKWPPTKHFVSHTHLTQV